MVSFIQRPRVRAVLAVRDRNTRRLRSGSASSGRTRCVPGCVFATRELLPQAAGDKALERVANVATLPHTVRASYAMPDG